MLTHQLIIAFTVREGMIFEHLFKISSFSAASTSSFQLSICLTVPRNTVSLLKFYRFVQRTIYSIIAQCTVVVLSYLKKSSSKSLAKKDFTTCHSYVKIVTVLL